MVKKIKKNDMHSFQTKGKPLLCGAKYTNFSPRTFANFRQLSPTFEYLPIFTSTYSNFRQNTLVGSFLFPLLFVSSSSVLRPKKEERRKN